MTLSEKRRATMIKKYGSEEAWKNALREHGSKGGKSPKTAPSGFAAMTPEKLAEVSRKGGMGRKGYRKNTYRTGRDTNN